MCPLQNNSKTSFKFAFLILIIMTSCLTADAKTYLIWLPPPGSYTMGQCKSFAIDLGGPLYQINEVRFLCQGTVTAGLDEAMCPFTDRFYGYFNATPGFMLANGPFVGLATYPEPEPFSANVKFNSHSGATWDFLLDGYADCQVCLDTYYTIPENPQILIPASGYLSAALIQIDAIPLLIGDFDLSGKVDMTDFAILASAWMTQAGDPHYNSDCDISDPPDNIIDFLDLAKFCDNWLSS